MCSACRIIKITDKYLECVILVAFPRQEWLRDHACCYVYVYMRIVYWSYAITYFIEFSYGVSCVCVVLVPPVQQKSNGLKFSKSRTVVIIRVVLFSLCLCIRGVALSSVHYNQSRRVYINQRHQYIFRGVWLASSVFTDGCRERIVVYRTRR
jgi:hypothetical protein